ncbi:MAG TPA: xanthine dehydrogenase family protein molybdopterin-binding subunit [Opitutaceae bacterium]|nr:xanthine dehydrogenase family protein molybdopterin-binding subunit [Opitutaceae bacterium]
MPAVLGQPLDRIDGRRKVTGRANYAADNRVERVAHAYGVMSPMASGEITEFDAGPAENAPGVIAVLHHGNIPGLRPCPDEMGKGRKSSETRPPFADQKVYYAGQFVALVVAETFEQARDAARLVRVRYRRTPPALSLDDGIAAHGEQPQEDESHRRGDFERALAGAEVRHDAVYTTPVEVHNAMELHATLAEWHGDRLTLHDSTQWVVGQPKSLAHVLGLPEENVTVLAPFIGGGFGSKLFLWPHCTLAAVAARQVQRPVKLVLPRPFQFTTAGHRPVTRQRIQLGATRDGKLVSFRHDATSHTSLVTEYVESCTESTGSIYECANVALTQSIVPVNVGSPCSMRGPGSCPGMYALESAMDELAEKLALDPLALRRKNLPSRDGKKNLPWSSIHFDACLQRTAERFGWNRRDPRPGAMRDGREILGWGFAAATWPAHRLKADVRTELRPDGTARVACATQDIGTGTYTVLAQVVAELTGLPFAKIEVAIGDSSLPPGPISGGSMATATVVPAVAQATRRALQNWRERCGGDFPSAAANRSPAAPIAGEAHAEPGGEQKKFSFRSFGAHCVEVRWDPGISRLRVSRIATTIDAGRIINRKTARNQIEGALIMGLGMALLEESIYDSRDGRVVTDNLADYHVAVHADAPALDVDFIDEPDPSIGDFGAKGLGEIGLTGIAAAIANAVYHATGKRVRDLPITIEKLLA